MAEKTAAMTTFIREYRKKIKMSQTELAKRVGVRRETIGRLEKGKYNPSLKLALDISKELCAKVEDLFNFKSDVIA
ncbi:MAG: helix-turn-helix transcriptional regulator [Eubacteriales bacterium]|nr:helix-turn-helix transcriptional regulator [Eubacteriales bacterium]